MGDWRPKNEVLQEWQEAIDSTADEVVTNDEDEYDDSPYFSTERWNRLKEYFANGESSDEWSEEEFHWQVEDLDREIFEGEDGEIHQRLRCEDYVPPVQRCGSVEILFALIFALYQMMVRYRDSLKYADYTLD